MLLDVHLFQNKFYMPLGKAFSQRVQVNGQIALDMGGPFQLTADLRLVSISSTIDFLGRGAQCWYKGLITPSFLSNLGADECLFGLPLVQEEGRLRRVHPDLISKSADPFFYFVVFEPDIDAASFGLYKTDLDRFGRWRTSEVDGWIMTRKRIKNGGFIFEREVSIADVLKQPDAPPMEAVHDNATAA